MLKRGLLKIEIRVKPKKVITEKVWKIWRRYSVSKIKEYIRVIKIT